MPPSQRGTGFQNFQNWLSLNQGTAARMGGDIATRVEDKGKTALSGMTGLDDRFRTAVANGTLSAPGTMGSTTAQQARDSAAGGYTGPESYGDVEGADVAAVTLQAANAQRDAAAAGTQAGKATMLTDKYGQTSWGGGQLDAALAGAGSAGGRIAKAQGAYGKLLERFGNMQAQGAKAVQSAKDTSATNAAAWGTRATIQEQQGRHVPRAPQPVREREPRPESRNRNPRNDRYTYP